MAKRVVWLMSCNTWLASRKSVSVCSASGADAGADVVKVAVTAKDSIDQIAVYRATRAIDGPSVILAMGDEGLATRLLGLRDGAAWSYPNTAHSTHL